MLDAMGTWYVIDNCLSYCAERARERDYQIYVTDTIKALNDNLAHAFGGKSYKVRFADLRKKAAAQTTETPEEIIDRISAKLAKIGGEANGGRADGAQGDIVP